jgi:hypothetical protein
MNSFLAQMEALSVHQSPKQDLKQPRRLQIITNCDNWFVSSTSYLGEMRIFTPHPSH